MHRNEYLEPTYDLSPVGCTSANTSPAGRKHKAIIQPPSCRAHTSKHRPTQHAPPSTEERIPEASQLYTLSVTHTSNSDQPSPPDENARHRGPKTRHNHSPKANRYNHHPCRRRPNCHGCNHCARAKLIWLDLQPALAPKMGSNLV